MEKQDIVRAILSKDEAKITEAKVAFRALLDTRATQFRADSTKFVAKSLFESRMNEPSGKSEHHSEAISIVASHSDHKPTSSRPGVEDRHETTIHSSKHQKLHKALTSAGFKHKHDGEGHTYTKGGTHVGTVSDGDEHHDVFIHSGKVE